MSAWSDCSPSPKLMIGEPTPARDAGAAMADDNKDNKREASDSEKKPKPEKKAKPDKKAADDAAASSSAPVAVAVPTAAPLTNKNNAGERRAGGGTA